MVNANKTRHWLLLVAALLGCGDPSSDDDAVSTGGGALFVEVRDARGTLVPDAVVTTEPPTETATTDAAGTVLMDALGPGTYLVRAEHTVAGIGADAALVKKEQLTRASIELDGYLDAASGGTSGYGGTGGSSRGGTGGSSRGGTGGSLQGGTGGSLTGGSGGNVTGGSGAMPPGESITIDTQVEAMLVDPQRPYLYALDRVNNSLHFVNLDTKMAEKDLFVGSSPVDFDFDDAGDYLYIANFGSTQIAVVDLETQEVARTIFVDVSGGTWQGNPWRIVYTAGDTLVFTSEDQWNSLKLVKAENGASIADSGTIYQPDLAASPDGTHVFAGESSLSTITLTRWDVSDTGLAQADEGNGVDGYGGGSVRVSGDGRYVFWARQKILATNLKSVLGQFSEEILAVNEDGSLAIGSSKVFDAVTFKEKGALSLTTKTLALAPDGTTLYLYDLGTSRIYVQDLTELD